MVRTLLKKIGGAAISYEWFGTRRPPLWRQFTVFRQNRAKVSAIGFVRCPFYTKIVDLSRTEQELLDACEKATAYKIRRAVRDGVACRVETDIRKAIDFYNEFARGKGLQPIADGLSAYRPHLIITVAEEGGASLAMHYYLCDPEAKVVRMLHSASSFRQSSDPSTRQHVGRANRLLHYEDMVLFKRQGFAHFDLGGYAFETNNEELKKINEFKDDFGGDLVEQSDYVPWFIYIVMALARRPRRRR